MSRSSTLILFFTAIFLQSGAYGLTFMLPRLFDSFGASEQQLLVVAPAGGLEMLRFNERVLAIARQLIAQHCEEQRAIGQLSCKNNRDETPPKSTYPACRACAL